MSTFHLHARLLQGPLSKPVRDEWLEHETDRWDEVEMWAGRHVQAGFTVWVYDHGHQTPFPFASDLRRIAWARPGQAPEGITLTPSRTQAGGSPRRTALHHPRRSHDEHSGR